MLALSMQCRGGEEGTEAVVKDSECPRAGTCEALYHVRNCDGYDWYECPIYDKIMDHEMEARDLEKELNKESEEEENESI